MQSLVQFIKLGDPGLIMLHHFSVKPPPRGNPGYGPGRYKFSRAVPNPDFPRLVCLIISCFLVLTV